MKLFSRWSLRTKLSVVVSAVIGLVSLAIFVDVPSRLRAQALEEVVDKAHTLAAMSAVNAGSALASEDRSGVEEALAAVRQNADLVYELVFDGSGRVVAAFNRDLAERYGFRAIPMAPRARGAVPPGAAARRTVGGFSPDDRAYQVEAPVVHRGRRVGQLYLALSLDGLNAEIRRSRSRIALLSLVIFVFGVAAVFGLSTLVTGPLSRIASTTRAIADGDIGSRAPVRFDDEVGRLAGSFNEMVDRLQSAHRELADLNRSLEQRVRDRTRELTEEVEERRRVESALRKSEEKHRLFLERNLAGVYVADESGTLLTCNDACARLIGYESGAELVSNGGAIETWDPRDRVLLLEKLRREGVVSNQEVALRTRTGEQVWALENVRMIPGAPGGAAVLEGILLDINDRKRTQQEIENRALFDGLTGLPNRLLFQDRIRVAVAHARRSRATLAVMFLDLDDLKVINDTLGHSTGDQLLVLMAKRLKACLRAEDTFARMGGDEFVVLLPATSDEASAEDVAEKILVRASEPYLVGDEELHTSVSIGVALFPRDGEDPDSLLKAADAAMYRVKLSGGNRVQLASRFESVVAPGRYSLEEQLESAIRREEFVAFYQPQVDVRNRNVVGYEALVRWRHPEGTIVQPSGFIALAEQTGRIIPIGEIMLRQACRHIVALHAGGRPGLRVGVNVSPRQFYQRDFIGMVRRVLEETGLEPRLLELEITESLALQRTDRSMQMLRELKNIGVGIAMDDFGTGQSSLTYLHRFPIDAVKIDQSFVREVGRHRNVDAIVIATLLLANRIEIRTVAEGVETEVQRVFLEENGCREMQGYLVSPPLPAEEVEIAVAPPPLSPGG